MTLTLNLQACRQPLWAQVIQVKPTRKDYLYYDGTSSITTKHAKVIQQSTPQTKITSQNLSIAQMSETSVRNKFTWPTFSGATRKTTTQRVPSKRPVDPTLLREIRDDTMQSFVGSLAARYIEWMDLNPQLLHRPSRDDAAGPKHSAGVRSDQEDLHHTGFEQEEDLFRARGPGLHDASAGPSRRVNHMDMTDARLRSLELTQAN